MLTKEYILEQLNIWYEASSALATGKRYQTSNGMSLERADSATIERWIKYWQGELARIDPLSARKTMRAYKGVPKNT